jgi:diketogulonate reductase-like aldo/keto reductase
MRASFLAAVIRFLLLHVALSVDQPQEPKECLVNKPTVRLHNGVEMPLFSLGTAHLITSSDPDPAAPVGFIGMLPERAYRQMELALQVGIRAFDTAHIYRSQRVVGHVLGEWWRTGQLKSRNDVWLTTKIFHPDAKPACFVSAHMPDLPSLTPDQVTAETRRFFEKALDELGGIGYIDLMLLHWPGGAGQGSPELNRQQRFAAWKVLEEMYRRGWCRAIGVSNFSVEHLKQLQQDGASIVPMVNQIEGSVITQYKDIREYCKENGIVPQAYSPFRGMSSSSSTISNTTTALVTKYNKESGQILLRYLFQHGYAIVYLSRSKQRMTSNMAIFDFELRADEMNALDQLNRNEGSWGLPAPHEIY